MGGRAHHWHDDGEGDSSSDGEGDGDDVTARNLGMTIARTQRGAGGAGVVVLLTDADDERSERFGSNVWPQVAGRVREAAGATEFRVQGPSDGFAAAVAAELPAEERAHVRELLDTRSLPATVVFARGTSARIPAAKHRDAAGYLRAVLAAVGERQETVPPSATVAQVVAAIKAEPAAPVLVLFHAAWCHICVQLLKDTWHEDVRERLRAMHGTRVFNILTMSAPEDVNQLEALVAELERRCGLRDREAVIEKWNAGVPCIMVFCRTPGGDLRVDGIMGGRSKKELLEEAGQLLESIVEASP